MARNQIDKEPEALPVPLFYPGGRDETITDFT